MRNIFDGGGTAAEAVMPSLHEPQRGENEGYGHYVERRADAQRDVRRITGHGLNGGTNSRAKFRDDMRKSGTMGKRTRASDALMAAWAAKRITKAKHRDEHGAYTLVGRITPTGAFAQYMVVRRIWLGGISAQRGY